MDDPFNFMLWEQARREHPSDSDRRQARYRELKGEPPKPSLPTYYYVEPEETNE